MTIQRLSIIFAALGLGLIGLSAQPTPQSGVQPPVVVYPSSGMTGSGTVTAAQGLFPDGTSALPSIAFTSEPNTGFYHTAGVIRAAITGTASALVITNGAASVNGTFSSSAVGVNVTPVANMVGIVSTAFASLGTPANGTLAFCADCTVTTAATCPGTQASCICAGSGGGAFARRVAGAWYCTF